MPRGIYYRVSTASLHRYDIVAVCLPTIVARTGLNGSLFILPGRCAERHTTPVLKMLIALPGDNVVVTSQSLCVNQQCYSAPQQTIDRYGKRVQRFTTLSHYHNTRGYWLYGQLSPTLFLGFAVFWSGITS